MNSGVDFGFTEGLNLLIIKTKHITVATGSKTYNRRLYDERRKCWNLWFENLYGIHNTNFNSIKPREYSAEYECRVEFFCLLQKLADSRKFDLRTKLDNLFITVSDQCSDGDAIFPIILFLLRLQRTDSVVKTSEFHLDFVDLPANSVRRYGDTRSLCSNQRTADFYPIYPNELFFKTNLRQEELIKGEEVPNYSAFNYLPQLSKFSSVKSSCVLTSDYCSEASDDDNVNNNNCNAEQNVVTTFSVNYPYSEYTGVTQSSIDGWEKEFMNEWRAFEQGVEVPKRFIWESRGINVGAEKPRLTEWRPQMPVDGSSIAFAVYTARNNFSRSNQFINHYLNLQAVPVAVWLWDLILLRQGVSSYSFRFDKNTNSFSLNTALPDYLVSQIKPHIKCGTIFARLWRLIRGDDCHGFRPSAIRDNLSYRLKDVLTMHMELYSSLSVNYISLIDFSVHLEKLSRQIEYLGQLFYVDPDAVPSWPHDLLDDNPIKMGGLLLLKYLYQITINQISSFYFHLTFYLLEGCLNNILQQLNLWLFRGFLTKTLDNGETDDFFVFTDCRYVLEKDHKWWSSAFGLYNLKLMFGETWLFDEIADDLLRCGKSICLLGLIDPTNVLLQNVNVIKSRPKFELRYETATESHESVKKYQETVEYWLKDLLKTEEHLLDEKKNEQIQKAADAQKIREGLINRDLENIRKENEEIFAEKQKELERLKLAAEEERRLRKEKIDEEKRIDRERLRNAMELNRTVIDELKNELIEFYSKKFADVEARERNFQERIADSQRKLITNLKSDDFFKVDSESVNQVIDTMIGEVSPNETRIEDSNKSSKPPYDALKSVIQELMYPGKYHSPKNQHKDVGYPSNFIFESPMVQNVDRLTKYETKDSSGYIEIQNQLPDSKIQNPNAVENPRGHFFDSKIQNEFLSKSKGASVYSHPSTSVVQYSLYPSDVQSMQHPKNTNFHMHPSASTIQESMYDSTNLYDNHSSEAFKEINTHGHPSESIVHQSLYPDISPSSETNLKYSIKLAAHGHMSDSTVQESLYPQSENHAMEIDRMDYFKKVNVYGHPTQSSIKDVLYPGISVDKIAEQTNNSNLVVMKTDIAEQDLFMERSLMETDQIPVITIEKENQWIWNIIKDHKTIEQTFQSRIQMLPMSFIPNVQHLYQFDLEELLKPMKRFTFIELAEQVNNSSSNRNSKELFFGQPLDLIINQSLFSPITTQIRLVDEVILHTFLQKFRLRDHLIQIRNFLFLEDGRFSSSLLPTVFNIVSQRQFLQSFRYHILAELVKSSVHCIHVEEDCCCGNVHLANLDQQNFVQFNNELDRFLISYQITWPLNIVINNNQMRQYQSIFRAIVQIKYSIWCLSKSRIVIKSWYFKSFRENRESFSTFQPIYSCLNEMDHWVRCIDSCLGNQVSGSGAESWKNLLTKIDKRCQNCNDLDKLLRSHAEYLDDVVLRFLLGGDQTEVFQLSESILKSREDVRNMIINLLKLCVKFFGIISVNRWNSVDGSNRIKENEKIIQAIKRVHSEFKVYAKFLLRILSKASQDAHLEHLLISLNYNEFYMKYTAEI